MMSEWWTYSPSDLLMFSPRVYYRLLEQHNEALWPAQLLALMLGFAVLAMLWRPMRGSDRLIPVILGAQWILVAWAFLFERYATINWAALYVAPAFVLEGALLIAAGLFGRGLAFSRPRAGFADAGVALFFFALVCYPLIALVMQRPWQTAEVFGIAADPTAVATLAALALAIGRLRIVLMVIPALWCAITGLTLWVMGAGDFFIAPAGAAVAIAVAILKTRDPRQQRH